MQTSNLTPLQTLLGQFRDLTHSQRDKGTSFENLMVRYFQNEPFYKEKYAEILSYFDWVEKYGDELGIGTKKDTGIDLVAITYTGEHHAIQCKNFSSDHKVRKSDIDSFFTASGKSYFSYRIIVTTSNEWTDNANDALSNQNPPVSRIDLYHLENSVIDWSQYQENKEPVIRSKKQLREHQKEAQKRVVAGLQDAERGKLIMACGTGKTFTALRLAEELAGSGKRVLFLVPSLSLLGQTLNEWTQDSLIPLNSFAVCSDSDIGKKTDDDDRVITGLSDLQFPATTNAKSLCDSIVKTENAHPKSMTVVFSTYHSIDVISQAQKQENNPLSQFDLIICDEAHRTTGATFDGDDESTFVRVHNNDYIKAKKRLYMTATPRIYGTTAKSTENVTLCSMDDESLYGKELYVITFSEAVSRKLLVDYKVIVLAVEESHINKRLQDLLKDENNSLKVDDAAKIVGCWKALSKQGLFESGNELGTPMQRAVAFCQVIGQYHHEKDDSKPTKKATKHKVGSKNISEMFQQVVEAYQQYEIQAIQAKEPDVILDPALSMVCEADHVDGGMNATEKESKLQWLKNDLADNHCRILSNVRCLSEGVDVPSLDAVLFLTPRNSEVDVVQSVGRVMRLAPNKKLGYVILPVVIPAGVEPEKALDDNQTYKVVWQVLNALRAHDDRFDAMINKLEFNGGDSKKMEVVAVAEKVTPKSKKVSKKDNVLNKARQSGAIGQADTNPYNNPANNIGFNFEVGEIERALYAKIVKKCGNRHHWEDWSNDIAKIAQTHIDRIKAVLADSNNTKEIEAFNAFAIELRDDLNNSISDDEIIEMLAQHLITKPVFDALFDKYSFAEHNPMSKAMQAVLDILQEQHLEKERDTLQSFYDSVKMRAEGINSAEGKQKIVVELYDKFFRNAFPRMTERLGIVYTPVEVVDFIIHSVEHVLKTEFGKSMADENVHILDPFTGTGTFITRLLQSGIIPTDKLPHKYQNEIHANEIVLLAYYIAAINIEATYHGILNNNIHGENDENSTVEYQPFNGICLTDTFEMAERGDLHDQMLVENSARRKRQKELDIRVIIGNPPYSAGQESANDNNANVEYPVLDGRIRHTYAANSNATNKNALYDSYIRAIRWSSDRIKDCGVIGFVTNAGFIEANTADGLRKCLVEEFSNLYVFHLRGNQRTSGERSRKEGGKIFGSGSRAPIAISILVKNPDAKQSGQIFFHDIGDYLSQAQKLEIIQELGSIKGIEDKKAWDMIEPDEFGDWVNQRDPNFDAYMSLGDKKDKTAITVFETYSKGLMSGRDAWCVNASTSVLSQSLRNMIGIYNQHIEDGLNSTSELNTNSAEISWNRSLQQLLDKRVNIKFEPSHIVPYYYRPYSKQKVYFNKHLNEMTYRIPKMFVNGNQNFAIILNGIGVTKAFSTLITNVIPDVQNHANCQCFPLYLYDKVETHDDDLFANTTESEYTRRDAITDDALKHFQDAYPSCELTKEDIFYYIYGLLHSEEYRERYADNLTKQLPRIPRVKTFEAFKAFSDAGRKLADLHLNYETVDIHTGVKLNAKIKGLNVTKQAVIGGVDEDFRVTKMKFSKKDDKSIVVYNSQITIENIPECAYDYVVNGKPALEWVMERQAVTTDKKSGITNDANDWAIETMGNAKYSLELFLRVITVSLETQNIVNSLPKLEILN